MCIRDRHSTARNSSDNLSPRALHITAAQMLSDGGYKFGELPSGVSSRRAAAIRVKFTDVRPILSPALVELGESVVLGLRDDA